MSQYTQRLDVTPVMSQLLLLVISLETDLRLVVTTQIRRGVFINELSKSITELKLAAVQAANFIPQLSGESPDTINLQRAISKIDQFNPTLANLSPRALTDITQNIDVLANQLGCALVRLCVSQEVQEFPDSANATIFRYMGIAFQHINAYAVRTPVLID